MECQRQASPVPWIFFTGGKRAGKRAHNKGTHTDVHVKQQIFIRCAGMKNLHRFYHFIESNYASSAPREGRTVTTTHAGDTDAKCSKPPA